MNSFFQKYKKVFGISLLLIFYVVYSVAFILFGDPYNINIVSASLIPVVIIAYIYGYVQGFIFGFATIGLNLVLFKVTNTVDFDTLMKIGGGSGALTLIAVTIIAGYFHELHNNLKEEFKKRIEIQNILDKRELLFQVIGFAAQSFLTSNDLEESLIEVASRFGVAERACSVYIFKTERDVENHKTYINILTEWISNKKNPKKDDINNKKVNWEYFGLSAWEEKFKKGEGVQCNIKSEMHAESFLNILVVNSVLVVPIVINSRFWGGLIIGDIQKNREWTLIEIETLKIAANIIAAAYNKKYIEEDLLSRSKDLEEMNRRMIGREMKMIEMKKILEGIQENGK